MANIIENLIYDGSLDVDFSNLQIKIKINSEEKNVKIGALWFKDGANFSQLSSLEQFDKFKGKSLFVKTLEGKYAKVSISSKPEIFYSSAASVRPKITTNIIKPTKQQVVSFEEQVAGTMKTVQKNIELQHGAKRTYLADINNKLTTDDTYIMVKIKGYKQPTYVKKSEIIYDNSSTVKTLLDLMNLKKADLEEFIKNNRFYYKGTLIEGISTAYEYSCEELLSYEELDAEHATRKTVELKQNAKISSGKITYEIANESTVSLDPYYSDQHYVKKEEQEGNDPEKKTEVAKIQIRNAKLAQDGEFIKVVIAGEMAHTLVKLSDIYDLHSNTQITDLTQLGGQAVRIKQADGTFVTTEPLTYEQVSLRYDTIKSFQPAPEDMQPMAEEAYLKLSNGKYIKEAEAVKPMAYKYVIDENTNNFDIYRVKVLDSNPPQYVLVTKEFVEKQAVINPTTESGAKLDLGDCKKMQRTPDLKTCDVIQTSSAGKDVEACKILPPVNTAARRAELSDSMRAFETGYKNGTYKLTSVYNKDNQLCTLDKSSAKRFVFTDTFEIEDKAERSIEYKSMKFNKLIFDERKGKNGTFTVVTGGPEFSFKNATSEGYKNLGKIFGATFAASMNPAGIFAILAFYPVVALGLAGMVAAIPGIPIVNAFRKLKNIIKPDKLKEKVEIQRKEDKKEIELLLENLLETSKKQEMTAENILKMDQRFEEINQRIIALSRANVNTKFQIVNGQCEITTDMAPFVIEYKRQHKKDFKKLNKVEAQIAKKEKSVAEYKKELAALEKQKGKLKAEKYDKLLKKLHKKYGDDPLKHLAEMKKDFSEARTKYDSEMAYFVTSSQEKETASFRDELNKKSNNMQAFLYLKYAYKNKDQIRDAKINVEAIDQEKLKDIEFDLTTGQLLYKNKSFEHYDKKEKNTDQDRALLAVFKNIEDAMKAIVEKGITIKKEEIIEKPHEQEGAVFEPAIIEEQEEMVVAEDILEDALEEEQEFDINPIEEERDIEDFLENIMENDHTSDYSNHRNNNLLQQQVDELREELKNSNNAIQTLQNDVNARQAAVEKLNAEKKKLEDKIKELKKSLKDENKNNKELTKELENLNKQLEQAKKDYDDTKALLKKAKEEKEALNVKIADLEKENKNLAEQNQLAEEKIEKLEAYKQKFEDIKVEKEKLEAEKKKIQEDLTKTIEERNSEISKLKDKISKLDEKLTDYKEKIAKLKEENKNLKSSNEALEKEKKELKGKIDKLNSKVDEIIKEKEALEKDLRAQLADAKSEAEQTKIKLKEKEKAIDALNNELTELKADFEKMTQENADLKEQNAQKDNQIRLIEEKLKTAQLLAMQERLAREKLEEENKRKQDELQKLKDKRQQQIKSLEKDVDGLKNAISNIKAQIKLKEQELKQINDNITLSGNNEEQLKLINKEIEVYNKARKSIISAIDNVYTDLLRCEGVAEGLISQADDLDKATLKAIVKQIRSIMNDSATQTKIVENLATKKIKFENNINTKLNSEQKLKDLLESKDSDLLDYLQSEGVSIADADIKAVIARIDKRHQAGAAAMQNAANLKNKNINDILTVGQEYITEILAKGNDLSV